MDMIGHQRISVNTASSFISVFVEPIQIENEILFGEEARLAIITALDDMERNAGEEESSASWHWGKDE
ncbi:MAG: hypothetical protein Q8O33_04110 [Pseudomonadota bacterium]|nr:hypothetical protein [Pseudomonadota bacterium]